MGFLDELRALAGRAIPDPWEQAARDARAYLGDRSREFDAAVMRMPVLGQGITALGEATPGRFIPRLAGMHLDQARGLLDGRGASAVVDPLARFGSETLDIQQRASRLTTEPLIGGINRALGVSAPTDVWQGGQVDALKKRARDEYGLPGLIGATALEQGLDWTNYGPGVATAVGKAGVKGLGKAGLRELLSALATGAGMEAGGAGLEKAVEQAGGDENARMLAKTAGTLGGGILGGTFGAAAVSDAFKPQTVSEAATAPIKPLTREALEAEPRVALNIGNPLPPWATGMVAGAAIGGASADPDASPEERAWRAIAGAAAGAGGVSLARSGLMKKAINRTWTWDGDVRDMSARYHDVMNQQRALSDMGKVTLDGSGTAPGLASVIENGAVIDPLAHGSLMQDFLQSKGAGVLDRDQVEQMMNRVEFIAENRSMFRLSPEAQAALAEYDSLNRDQFLKELRAGVWDGEIAKANEKYQQYNMAARATREQADALANRTIAPGTLPNYGPALRGTTTVGPMGPVTQRPQGPQPPRTALKGKAAELARVYERDGEEIANLQRVQQRFNGDADALRARAEQTRMRATSSIAGPQAQLSAMDRSLGRAAIAGTLAVEAQSRADGRALAGIAARLEALRDAALASSETNLNRAGVKPSDRLASLAFRILTRMDQIRAATLDASDRALDAAARAPSGRLEPDAARLAIRMEQQWPSATALPSDVRAREAVERGIDRMLTRNDAAHERELLKVAADLERMAPRQTIEKTLDALLARNDRMHENELLKIATELDGMAARQTALFNTVMDAATATQPAQVNARIASMFANLDRAEAQAVRALMAQENKGLTNLLNVATAIDRLAARVGRHATGLDNRIGRIEHRRTEAVQREIDKLRQTADGMDAKAAQQQALAADPSRADYFPHYYLNETPAMVGSSTPVTVGGKAFFQNARAYDTYWEAVLDGAKPVFFDGVTTAGDQFGKRFEASARAIAHRQFINDALASIPEGAGKAWVMPGLVLSNAPEEIQKQYVKVSPDILVRLTGGRDDMAQMANAIIDALPSKVARSERAKLHEQISRGDLWVRKDAADWLRTTFERSRLAESEPAQKLERGREMALSADFFYGGWQLKESLAQGFAHNTLNPGGWFRGAYHGLQAAFSPGWFENYKNANRDDWLRVSQYMQLERPKVFTPGSAFEEAAKPTAWRAVAEKVGKVPVAGGVLALAPRFFDNLEKAQFERLAAVLKYDAFKAMERVAKRARPNADETQLLRAVGRYVDTAFGGSGSYRWGKTADQDVIERFTFLTSNYMRGQLEANLAAPTQNIHLRNTVDPEVAGMLARRFWTRAIPMLLASATAVTLGMLYMAGERNPDAYWKMVNPSDPDSIFNPDGRNFGSVVTPGGDRIAVLGPLGTMIKTGLRPMWRAGDAAAKESEKGYQAMIGKGIEAFIGGLASTLPEYGEQRYGLMPRVMFDIAENKTFDRKPIATHEGLGGWGQRLSYALQNYLPGLAQAWKDKESPLMVNLNAEGTPTINLATPDRALPQLAGSFAGQPVTLARERDPQLRATVDAYLRERGIAPGPDPIGVFQRQPDSIKMPLYGRDPTVRARILADQEKTHVARTPVTEDRVSEYMGRVAQAGGARRAEILALEKQRKNGNEYREQVKHINAKYQGRIEQLQKDYLHVETAAEADALIEKYKPKMKPTELLDILADGYYAIQPENESQAAMTAFFDKRKSYMDGLSASDRAALEKHLDLRAAEMGQQYLDYHNASKVMSEYMEMPAFLIGTADEGKLVQAARQRARDRKRFEQSPLSIGTLILLDPEADSRTKTLALIVGNGNKMASIERKMFLQRYGHQLGRFYASYLLSEREDDLMGISA